MSIDWNKEHINISSSLGIGGLKRINITHVPTGKVGSATGLDYQKTKQNALDNLESQLLSIRLDLRAEEKVKPFPKTTDDIVNLIEQWKADPSWDLTAAPGFEEFKDILNEVQTNYKSELAAVEKAATEELRKKWYTININESFKLDDWTTVRRVPTGWVLTTEAMNSDTALAISNVFIPFEIPRSMVYQD